jgi:hypothetical protein
MNIRKFQSFRNGCPEIEHVIPRGNPEKTNKSGDENGRIPSVTQYRGPLCVYSFPGNYTQLENFQ